MTALELIKDIYEMSGGDPAELDGLSKNDPNMISAIYGDGLNTKLPDEVVDSIGEWLAEQGGDSVPFTPNNLGTFQILYSVPKADDDSDVGYIFNAYHNVVDFGLSTRPNGNVLGWNQLGQQMESSPFVLICHSTQDGEVYLLPAIATYTNPETITPASDTADVYWTCLVNTRHSTREITPTTLTFGCSFVNDGREDQN